MVNATDILMVADFIKTHDAAFGAHLAMHFAVDSHEREFIRYRLLRLAVELAAVEAIDAQARAQGTWPEFTGFFGE